MHSNSAAIPRNSRHNQNEQTLERALMLGFIVVMATNVFWVIGGNLQQLSQHILSQLHSSLIHLQ
jgi:hypothetical protein